MPSDSNQPPGQIGSAHPPADPPNQEAGIGEPRVSTPYPVEIHWDREERDHRGWEKFYWGFAAILTFIAVVATVATVFLSKWSLDESQNATAEARMATSAAQRQADEAQRQTNIANISLKYSQRAFVYVKEAETGFQPYPPFGHADRWSFQPKWENLGNTQPIGLTLETHCGYASSEDLIPNLDRNNTLFMVVNRIIGPKQSADGPRCTIFSSQITLIQNGSGFSWRFMRAKYKDVFGEKHVTERSDIIIAVDGDGRNFSQEIKGLARPCVSHNCVDDQCASYNDP